VIVVAVAAAVATVAIVSIYLLIYRPKSLDERSLTEIYNENIWTEDLRPVSLDERPRTRSLDLSTFPFSRPQSLDERHMTKIFVPKYTISIFG
jgi:hypothetical protein